MAVQFNHPYRSFLLCITFANVLSEPIHIVDAPSHTWKVNKQPYCCEPASSSCVVIQQTTQRRTRDFRYALIASVMESNELLGKTIPIHGISMLHFTNDITQGCTQPRIYGPQILNPTYRLSCLRHRRRLRNTSNDIKPPLYIILNMHHICQHHYIR